MNLARRLVVNVVSLLCVLSASAWAAPVLELSVTGPTTALPAQQITLQVEYSVTEQGLGGLSYDLDFSEALDFDARDYDSFGWVFNDGLFDNSSPTGGDPITGTFSTIGFDTVVNPAGSELAAGSSGIVETFTVTLPADTTERYITLDIGNISASDGVGNDWEGPTINGTINTPSTYAVLVPEPISLLFCLAGVGLAAVRRRR